MQNAAARLVTKTKDAEHISVHDSVLAVHHFKNLLLLKPFKAPEDTQTTDTSRCASTLLTHVLLKDKVFDVGAPRCGPTRPAALVTVFF